MVDYPELLEKQSIFPTFANAAQSGWEFDKCIIEKQNRSNPGRMSTGH